MRELCAAAHTPENKLAYWLKPGTSLTRMPTMTQIAELAQIIGCTSNAVYRALRADVDGQAALEPGLTKDERMLLSTYRGLDEANRRRLLRIASGLDGGEA